MKKLGWALFALVFALCASVGVQRAHAWIHGVAGASMPLLVAGTFAPTAQTPLMPSASTQPPSCGGSGDAALDAAWGAGCDTSTGHCIKPTALAPLQSCQPPQMFVVTGGMGDGVNATIFYTSYAHYAYPNAMPLIISGAAQANWNTPAIGINAETAAGSGPYTETLGLTPIAPATTFALPPVGQTVYVGQATASAAFQGLTGQGWSTYVNYSGSGAVATATTYYHVPVTGGHGSGGTINITVDATGAVNSSTPTGNAVADIRGHGYLNGDLIGADTSGITGLSGMTNFTATVNFVAPNGVWSVQSANCSSGAFAACAAGTVTYSTGSAEVIGALGGLNTLGYNGTVQAPWVVSSSVCGFDGVAEHCKVTFPNPNACASSCVSAATQIAAGQNDNIILNWHYGEDVQNSLQNGDVRVCAIPKHISPIVFVSATLEGGPFTKVTSPIPDPWGPGKTGIAPPATPYSYCFHFDASAVADGLHEIRIIACATTGYCGQLSSVLAVDGTASSTLFKAHNHALQSMKLVGIQNSFDPNFQNYDWRAYTAGLTVTSGTASGGGASGDTFTLGFTQPANFPAFQAHQVINVSGLVTTESCSVVSGLADGAHLTLGLSGTCNFLTGSEVNISGINLATPAAVVAASYNSSSGLYTVQMASDLNGPTPTTGVGAIPSVNAYSLSLTGPGAQAVQAQIAKLNGSHQLVSYDSSTHTYTFQGPTGLTLITSLTGGTLAGNGLAWNSGAPATVSSGGVCSGGTCSIQIPSISTAVWASGGTVAANWNGNCIIASVTQAGSTTNVTCPQPFNTATARATGGTITAQGNLHCVVGGAGDFPAPYDPAYLSVTEGQFDPEGIRLQPYTSNNCTGLLNQTGCSVANCGTAPTQDETLWITRKDSGVDERRVIGSGVIIENVNGSLWITTNHGNAIKGQNAYVDPWKMIQGGTHCVGVGTDNYAPVAAGAPLTAYTGNYCTDLSHAMLGLVPTENGVTQALTQSGGCLVFTKAGNGSGAVPFYPGEPVEFTGYDSTSAGTDGNGNATPAFANWGVYWVKTLVGDAITLSAVPGGACINETPANIFGGTSVAASQALLYKDEGMDSLLIACDTAVAKPCSESNPETFPNKSSVPGLASATYYAKSGYLNISADTAAGSTFPATQSEVSLVLGAGVWFGGAISQGGRLRIPADTTQSILSLDTSIPVTKTPPITTVTGGSLSGTTVTLNFAALPAGVAWQVPTATGSPGQGIIVSGVTPADWNCGTVTAPCRVLSASPTQITYTNPAATTPAWSLGGKIVPATIVIEFPQGTFAYDSVNNPLGLCTGTGALANVAIDTHGAKSCNSAYFTTVRTLGGVNSSAFPFQWIPGANVTQPLFGNNCLPTGSGQGFPQQYSLNVFAEGSLPFIPGDADADTHDIMELTWDGVAGQAFSFNAFNDCVGPWQFSNRPIDMRGFASQNYATDVWADGRDVFGPSWNAPVGAEDIISSATGAGFITNGLRYNVHNAFDQTSYTWGSNAEYNDGICGNAAGVLVWTTCTGGEHAVPLSLGGSNQTGAIRGPFWLPVLGALDASGTPTTCSGAPCTNSSTRTLQVATGTLPGTLTPGWIAYLICNFSNPLDVRVATTTAVGIAVTTYNDASSPATATFSSGMGANCPISQHPTIIFYSITHVDMFFWSSNQTVAPLLSGFPWLWVNDHIYENVWCLGCVQMQGLFMAGFQYFDDDFDDDDVEVMNVPQELTIQAIGYGGSGTFNQPISNGSHYNFLLKNTNLFGPSQGVSDSGETLFQDVYHIANNGGTWVGYPWLGQGNALYGGTFGLSGAQNSPALNAPVVNGSYQNLTVFPSQALGVDASGNPAAPGNPWSGSMSGCPFYCAPADTGLGSM